MNMLTFRIFRFFRKFKFMISTIKIVNLINGKKTFLKKKHQTEHGEITLQESYSIMIKNNSSGNNPFSIFNFL